MAATTSPLRGRIHYLDGLRAVAVLAVLFSHVATYDLNLHQGPLLHGMLEGAHGVDLFFVISGFVLSYPLLAKLHAQGGATFDIARYLAHRFIRILPPYLFAIGFAALVFYSIQRWQLSFAPDIINPGITWLEVLKQMFFLDQRPHLLNTAFWSLAVEFRWYFLFPLLLLLWTKSPRAFGLVLATFVFLGQLTRAASLDVFVMPAFMLGIVAADIEIRRLPLARWSGLLAVAALAVTIAIEPAAFTDKVQLGWQLTCFFFVVAAGAYPWLRGALSLGPLVAVGIISYSLYLVQSPVVGLIATNTAWGFFGGFFGAIVVAALFWALFERPFMATALKGTLTEKLQPPLSRLLALFGIPNEMRLQKMPSEASDTAAIEAHENVPAQSASAPTIAGS